MVLEYLQKLIKGNISKNLIDDAEHMYGDHGYSRVRFELVNPFTNITVVIDYSFVEQCWAIFHRIKKRN